MRYAGIIAVAFLALEIVGITLMGARLGVGQTLLWLLGSVLAGAWLIRGAGIGFAPGLMRAAASGQAPLGVLWTTGARVFAGILLILPGPFSDMLALILLLVSLFPTRRAPLPPPTAQPRQPDVIEGEFRREE